MSDNITEALFHLAQAKAHLTVADIDCLDSDFDKGRGGGFEMYSLGEVTDSHDDFYE
jgi:hypothetical protein